jgi:hypothetical protein
VWCGTPPCVLPCEECGNNNGRVTNAASHRMRVGPRKLTRKYYTMTKARGKGCCRLTLRFTLGGEAKRARRRKGADPCATPHRANQTAPTGSGRRFSRFMCVSAGLPWLNHPFRGNYFIYKAKTLRVGGRMLQHAAPPVPGRRFHFT